MKNNKILEFFKVVFVSLLLSNLISVFFGVLYTGDLTVWDWNKDTKAFATLMSLALTAISILNYYLHENRRVD